MFRRYRYRLIGAKIRQAVIYRQYSYVSAKINTKAPDMYSINEMKEENEINASIFARLSKVYQILNDRKNRFRYAANDCRDIYMQNNASLLDDLLQYPGINKDMITFLFINYTFSNSVKALILDDLNRLLLEGKFDVIIKSFEKMIESGIVSTPVEDNFMHVSTQRTRITDIKLRDALADLIVNQAVSSGEHLLASSFALTFKAANISLNTQTILLLLRSLAIDTTTNHIYNSYTIIRVLNEFSTINISIPDVCHLLLYLAKGKQQPFFANILYDRILRSSLLDKQLEDNLGSFYEVSMKLMQKNIEHGDLIRATKIWHTIKDIKTPSAKNAVTLSTLIEKVIEADEEAADELCESVSKNIFRNPDLQDCILRYFGINPKHTEEFEKLIKLLEPPLRRLTLSLLFEAFLLQNNESGAEKILLFIFKSKNGINFSDFDAIIRKLIRQQKITQCIDMLRSTDIEICKVGYISIFKYIIRTSNRKEKRIFLEDLISRFHKLSKNDECFDLLTIAFFEYVSEGINNRVSRSLFTQISRSSLEGISNFHDSASELNLEQHSFPKGFLQLLSLEGYARLECLWIISNHAIKDHDLNTLKWCIEELRFSGVLLEDILSGIFKQDSLFCREVLQEESLPFL